MTPSRSIERKCGVRKRSRMVLSLSAVAASAALSLGAAGSAAAAAAPVSCSLVKGIPVTLSAGSATSYSISGELCATAAERRDGTTVQLLIHGATYDHTYWDFGEVDGVGYSYARDLAADGYPTFAIDEVGTTDARPSVPSADVTLDSVAYVAHEAIQDLKAGKIAGVKFGKVIEVGHSQGSYTTWVEAATYHDVAGVIITGAAHSLSTAAIGVLGSDFTAANTDPQFAGLGLDSGYETTVPGERGSMFYNPADSDPNVISRDEATKNVVSSTLVGDDLSYDIPSIIGRITAPVLVVLGGDDDLFCGSLSDGTTLDCSSGNSIASEEAPYYADTKIRACKVPGSGHDINLARNHILEEVDARAWSNEYVGQNGAPAPGTGPLPFECSN